MMQDKFQTKWLVFKRLLWVDRKTQVWEVISIKGVVLGRIQWFSRWRCYAFFPVSGTVFNSVCLKDIKDFIDRLMKDRR